MNCTPDTSDGRSAARRRSARALFSIATVAAILFVSPSTAAEESRAAVTKKVLSIDAIPVKADSDVEIGKREESGRVLVTRRATRTASSIVAFNPHAGTLWPGSIVRGAELPGGALASVRLPRRNPVHVTIEGVVLTDGSYSRKLDPPDNRTYQDAYNDLLGNIIPGPHATKLLFSSEYVDSTARALQKFNISARWILGSAHASFLSEVQTSSTRLLVKLLQSYYSVSVSTPSDPLGFFHPEADLTGFAGSIAPGNPPCYVSSITYGRMALVSVASSESEKTVRAALEAKWGFGDGEITEEQKRIVRACMFRAIFLGGSSSAAEKAVTGESINEWVRSEAAQPLAVPISYTVRYLKDNTIARVSYTSDYNVSTEQPRTRLAIRLVYLDVYLDGSHGKDTWSTWCTINGKEHQVWNRKPDISDNKRKNTPHVGPGGDNSYTRYSLANEYEVELLPTDELSVEFHGVAHDDNDSVDRSRATFTEEHNWGVGGSGHRTEIGGQEIQMHRIGACNDGQTEYYLYFSVRKLG